MGFLNPHNPAYNAIVVYILIVIVIYLINPSYLYFKTSQASNKPKQINIYQLAMIGIVIYIIFYFADY